jgi:hydroxymethylpyrimidine pyrophosphatase-like HAD family hydrolase
MTDIRLIATDLDGTLIGNTREFHLYTDFRDRINGIRNKNRCVWAVVTGRTLAGFRRFFNPMRTVGIEPDFIIARHAYIYGPTRFGFLPHIWWNLRMVYVQWVNRLKIHRVLDRWHRDILKTIPGVETLMRKKDRLWVSFGTEEYAASGEQLLNGQTYSSRYLRIFKYRKQIDVRCIPFTKGLALSELARHLGISGDHILTIGNGHNDASMLNGSMARYTGCPMNSEPEIVQLVHEAGGHIAGQPSLAGVLEILQAYETGDVRSELPGWWQNPEESDPSKGRSWLRGHSKRSSLAGTLLLVAAVTYIVLLVFARFNLVPCSGLIRKPFDMVMTLIRELAGLL